ncbi:energy transducer TonB [Lysobacter sp. M2-1]|uniref:energy transducer TonB n=2 Tax=unclassified Lysobacter TaxID=2635362 RepID=UPI001F5A21D2|nr:energy transducer TonB [Lysobacter sp. M2-1]
MSWVMNSGSRRAVRASVLVLALCAIGACKKEQAADQPGAEQAPAAQQQQAPPQQAVSSQVAAMGVDQLREAANKALSEQRLYAPAGDNAMEYYVALRDKAPTDAAVASALTDLMPYALIAAEQSIARDDLGEAQRLHALMEKVDPQAPALPRLKQGIADAQTTLAQRTAAAEAQTEEEAKRQADLERERLAEQQRAQQQAAQQLAAQQAAEQTAATQRAAEQRAAEQRAAEQRAAEQRQAQQPAAPASPPPAASAPASTSTALRAISTPAPVYPPSALRLEQSGEVLVEFTVDTDGTVTNARVVRATPPRVFDRAAISAVNKWRFQPVASSVTTRRTIAFNPGG